MKVRVVSEDKLEDIKDQDEIKTILANMEEYDAHITEDGRLSYIAEIYTRHPGYNITVNWGEKP